jgi:hypothetical protein
MKEEVSHDLVIFFLPEKKLYHNIFLDFSYSKLKNTNEIFEL